MNMNTSPGKATCETVLGAGNGYGRGRGRGTIDASVPLRRPHPGTLNSELCKESSCVSQDDASATAGLPAAGLPGKTQQATEEGLASEEIQYENLEKDVMHLMTNFINEVTNSPGSFELETELLLRDFSTWAESTVITKKVSKLIIEESITQPNFRYSGARLCSTLIQKSKDMQLDLFWNNLNSELQEEKKKTGDTLNQDPGRLCGFLMFLAELFVQLGGATSLCTDICYVIELLLLKETPESIKCVCQTLKLSGRYVDSYNHATVDKIVEQLAKIHNASCDKSISCQILSVTELRKSNWGDNGFSAQQEKSQPSDINNVVSEPIFYGPDGTILTEEESKFLEENFDLSGMDGDDDLDGLWDTEDPMNELDDAFEEFLRFSKQQ